MVRRYEAGELDTTDDIPADQIKSLQGALRRAGQARPLSRHLLLRRQLLEGAVQRRARAPGPVHGRSTASSSRSRSGARPCSRPIPSCRRASAITASPPRSTTRTCRRSTARKRPRRCSRRPASARRQAAQGRDPLQHDRQQPEHGHRHCRQWKDLGVETSFINTDGKTHFAYLRDGGDFDVARYGWIGDYSDPKNFLFLLKSDNKGFNYGKYNNPEFDDAR